MLSSTNSLLLEGAVSDLHRLKVTNRLLHARLAADPDGWVDKMISAAKNWETTHDNPFAQYDVMKVGQMEAEIDSLAQKVGRLGATHLAKLKKNRDEIARAYGAVELGLMFRSVLPLPGNLELTIDAASLVPIWNEKITKHGGPGLPKGIWEAWNADPGNLVGPRPEFYSMLETAVRAAPEALVAWNRSATTAAYAVLGISRGNRKSRPRESARRRGGRHGSGSERAGRPTVLRLLHVRRLRHGSSSGSLPPSNEPCHLRELLVPWQPRQRPEPPLRDHPPRRPGGQLGDRRPDVRM